MCGCGWWLWLVVEHIVHFKEFDFFALFLFFLPSNLFWFWCYVYLLMVGMFILHILLFVREIVALIWILLDYTKLKRTIICIFLIWLESWSPSTSSHRHTPIHCNPYKSYSDDDDDDNQQLQSRIQHTQSWTKYIIFCLFFFFEIHLLMCEMWLDADKLLWRYISMLYNLPANTSEKRLHSLTINGCDSTRFVC